MNDRETVDDLRALLRSEDVNERCEAVEVLAVLEDLPALLFAVGLTCQDIVHWNKCQDIVHCRE